MAFWAKGPMHVHQFCSFTYKMDPRRPDICFDALRPIIIDCIVLDKDGLGEVFMGLGETGCIFDQSFLFMDQMLRSKVLQLFRFTKDLEIIRLGEWMNRLREFKVMSRPHEDRLDEFKGNSASHRLNTFLWMKMNSARSRTNSAIRLKIVWCVVEGELVELLLDSMSKDEVVTFRGRGNSTSWWTNSASLVNRMLTLTRVLTLTLTWNLVTLVRVMSIKW